MISLLATGDDTGHVLLFCGAVLTTAVTGLQIIRRKKAEKADKAQYPGLQIFYLALSAVLLFAFGGLMTSGLTIYKDTLNLAGIIGGTALAFLLVVTAIRLVASGAGSIWVRLGMLLALLDAAIMTVGGVTEIRFLFNKFHNPNTDTYARQATEVVVMVADVFTWMLLVLFVVGVIVGFVTLVVRKIKTWRARRAAPTSGAGSGTATP